RRHTRSKRDWSSDVCSSDLRIVKSNIAALTDTLRKSLVLRREPQTVLSDRGSIVPARLWRIGRSSEARVFERELKSDVSDFVVRSEERRVGKGGRSLCRPAN